LNHNAEREYWRRATCEVLGASGWTVAALAAFLEVHPASVEAYKRGERPTGLVAVRLYELRRELIFGRNDSPAATSQKYALMHGASAKSL
jgi:hypothetical protein